MESGPGFFISEGEGTEMNIAALPPNAGGNVGFSAPEFVETTTLSLIQGPNWKDSVFVLAWTRTAASMTTSTTDWLCLQIAPLPLHPKLDGMGNN